MPTSFSRTHKKEESTTRQEKIILKVFSKMEASVSQEEEDLAFLEVDLDFLGEVLVFLEEEVSEGSI